MYSSTKQVMLYKKPLIGSTIAGEQHSTSFAYQRLSIDDVAPYSLHGFNAVYCTQVGWYRVDAEETARVFNQFCTRFRAVLKDSVF